MVVVVTLNVAEGQVTILLFTAKVVIREKLATPNLEVRYDRERT